MFYVRGNELYYGKKRIVRGADKPAHDEPIIRLAVDVFSAQKPSALAVTCDAQGTLRVWDAKAKDPRILPEHTDPMLAKATALSLRFGANMFFVAAMLPEGPMIFMGDEGEETFREDQIPLMDEKPDFIGELVGGTFYPASNGQHRFYAHDAVGNQVFFLRDGEWYIVPSYV